ncbi:MAG: thioredoxin domain-containing protein [Actinomycetes bacterium]
MSTNEPRQTKTEKQDAARAARQQATQADQASADRNKRLWQFGGILVVAIAIVVVIVLVAGGGSSSKTSSANLTGAAEIQTNLAGIPQAGLVIGKATAPLTLVEFGDLKCPVCRQFDVNSLPTIIKDYVRTGKLKFEIRLLHFLDGNTSGTPDSENAARFAQAAGLQRKGINFVELWYYNQQDEASVYATPDYLTSLGNAIPGLNSAKATKAAKLPAWSKIFDRNDAEFSANGFTGTPSFLFGKTGTKLGTLSPTGDLSQPSSFTTQFDVALTK